MGGLEWQTAKVIHDSRKRREHVERFAVVGDFGAVKAAGCRVNGILDYFAPLDFVEEHGDVGVVVWQVSEHAGFVVWAGFARSKD